ncbi:MAG: metallophosphoesterase [Nitrososphaeria archaeon]|nr:metallophosphoesterase family protein [Conexivisphaerales archaeon]
MRDHVLPNYLKFVEGYPAILIFNKYLAIADLHVGYEISERERGIYVPIQKERYIKRIQELKSITGAEELIIVGDVKDSILMPTAEEINELVSVFQEVSKLFKITIIQGNHDAYIDKILHNFAAYAGSEGIVLKNGRAKVGLAHGHARPSDSCLKSDALVLAHLHFYIKFENSKYPVWLVGKKGKQTLVLMPPFNDLLSGYYQEDVDAKVPFTDFKLQDLKVITLDGYNLGTLKDLRSIIEEESD